MSLISHRMMPIYKCKNTTRIFRENKEQEIIKLLKPDLKSSHHEQQASKKVVACTIEQLTMNSVINTS